MLIPKVIYVPVSVQEELPEQHEWVHVIMENGANLTGVLDSSNVWAINYLDNVGHNSDENLVTHFLKRIELPGEEEIKEKAESNFPINDKMSWEVREYVEWQRLQLQAGAKYILSIINQKK